MHGISEPNEHPLHKHVYTRKEKVRHEGNRREAGNVFLLCSISSLNKISGKLEYKTKKIQLS